MHVCYDTLVSYMRHLQRQRKVFVICGTGMERRNLLRIQTESRLALNDRVGALRRPKAEPLEIVDKRRGCKNG